MTNQPKPPSPITPPVTGKIKIIVSGKVTVKSSDPKIIIERRD